MNEEVGWEYVVSFFNKVVLVLAAILTALSITFPESRTLFLGALGGLAVGTIAANILVSLKGK